MTRRGPNTQLIEGARNLGQSKGFLDVGAAAGEGLKGYSDNSQNTASKKQKQIDENQNIANKVNTFMSKMKSDVDFTGFSPAETASMRNFLVAERSRYAEAAKAISRLDDASSPEYMQYVDIMQGVNNSFTNLADQIKGYKTAKAGYAEDQYNGILSDGNDPTINYQAAHMYGFYDANKDGKSDDRYDTPLLIKEGGNIAFNINGSEIMFNDFSPLIVKDYKAIDSILKSNESVYKKGSSLNQADISIYKNQLSSLLRNQDSLASVISDFNDQLPMDDIIWEPASKGFDINAVRTKVINRITQGYIDSANKGKAEKESKAQASRDAANQRSKVTILADGRKAQIIGDFHYINDKPVSKEEYYEIIRNNSKVDLNKL